MNSSAITAAGYLLLKPVPRPEWLSSDLLPDQIISGSTCLCPQFPGSYAISWCGDSAEVRAAEFDRIGLPADQRDEASRWATAEFERSFGWPGVFYDLEAAREARARFFPAGDVMVVALGLPAAYHAKFVAESTPPKEDEGFATQGKSGCLEVIERANSLPPGLTSLGYEPVNMTFGQIDCSWLCNHLEQYIADHTGMRPSPTGLIESIEEAARCCEVIERPDVGAEPGPWFPMFLARYDRDGR